MKTLRFTKEGMTYMERHNILMEEDTIVAVAENKNTGMENTEYMNI